MSFFFFSSLVFVPGSTILLQSFFGQKIQVRHGKQTNLCVCSSIPFFLSTSVSRNSVGILQKHQCWAGNQFHTIKASRNIQDEPGLLGLP